MDTQIEKLIQEYFPDDVIKAESLLNAFSCGLVKQFEKYSECQYRKYKSSVNRNIKDDPWVLGSSEGADYCIELTKKMLD